MNSNNGSKTKIDIKKSPNFLRLLFNEGLFSGINKKIIIIPKIPVLELIPKPAIKLNKRNRKYLSFWLFFQSLKAIMELKMSRSAEISLPA